ncbi:MAG TPA: protein kinase [Bryobacteraceae bacterium]|nr:protein kinase [Bryobacteraceae bacterium]
MSDVVQIGRYRILGELGRGATGVVYRAQDPAIGRIIAIKTIRLADFTDEAERSRLRERLFREAQSAGVLSHPNIVTIYDIAEEDDLAYIFMECVDGPPLEKVLNSGEPLSQSTVFSILRQTATALDYAHKKGIVHRDIKPANILIHEGTVAKITDFGVAKILSQQMTQAGVMMGTPNYMSPEQVQGHAVDGRADQFALAVIAYEILTGEKPFVADHLPSLLYRIVREDPVAPDRINPSLAPQVEVVLRKALAKSAADRYLACLDFVEALEGACNMNPGWHALPRSSAQSMPTVGAAAPASEQPRARAPEPPRTPEPAPPSFLDTTQSGRSSTNPMLKSLVWMLVGIGLVGLVLFGAQKYLFYRNTEPAAPTADAQAQPPAAVSDQSAAKPSPVGEPRTDSSGVKETPKPQAPPESTTPETPARQLPRDPEQTEPPSTAPAQPERVIPPPERPTPRPQRSIPPPVIAPKSDVAASVQFVTDPPHAQLIIDNNASLSCKTPCILSVPPGRHSLNVQLEGYRSYPRVFNVPQEKDIFLQLNKTGGTLSVTSSPPGAAIEINGEAQAKRTPAIFNFAPGNYRVKVSRNGAFLEFDVTLRDGEFVNKRVDF